MEPDSWLNDDEGGDGRPMAKMTDALLAARGALDYAVGWLDYRAWYTRVPGAQVAVMIGDDLIVNRAVGQADTSTEERLGTAHQFRIASHSKWFTATAFMRLAEADVLALDDPASSFVPELDGTAFADVTISELLSHGSGITRDSEERGFWSANGDFPDRDRLIEIVRDGADVLPANASFKYSNIGFGILGLVLEAVTERPYEEALRELVTRPLGLTKTVADVDDRKSAKPVSGHSGIVTDHRRTPLPNPSARALHAATGFTSTAAELARFGRAHVLGNDELLTDRSKSRMQRAHWTYRDRTGAEASYGLGTMRAEIDGSVWIGHGGSWLGQSTRTLVEPNLGIVIVVLTNAIDGPADEFARGIARLVMASQQTTAKPLSLAPDAGATVGSASKSPTRSSKRVDVSRFMGRFASEWAIVDVVQLGERLLAISPKSPDPMATAVELTVIDEETLRLPLTPGFDSVGELLHYDFDARGRVRAIRGGWDVRPASSLEAFPLS